MATLYVGSDQTYKTLQEAVNAATNGDTIVLKSNVTASDSISISKDLTVDLGGFTLDAMVYVKEAAAVEFKNGSMTYTNTNPSFGSAVITTGVYTDENGNIKSSGGAAALTLTNVTVKGGEAVNSRYYTDAVAYKSTGGLTITDSTIIGGTSTRNADCESIGNISSGANAIYVVGSGEVKIKNSKITGGYGKTEGEYTGYVSQMFSPGGTAISLSGSAAVTILNSEVTGGGSNWYNAESGINVSNQFKGTLSIEKSTVAGGTAEGKVSGRGTGGVGVYTNMSTGCKEITITDSTISGGDGGCSSNGNGIEYRNTNIEMTITNSTIEAGNGENAKGNGAALGIYNTNSTQVILDDVKLNGEGDGNTVIKYGHYGITVTGPVEVIGGTLEGSKVDGEIKDVKITVDATQLNGSQAVISGNVKDVEIELKAGDSGAILIEDGGVTYVTTETDVTKADKSVIYVNSAYSGEQGALVGPGRFLGINAFADVNAAEVVAKAGAAKMVIVNGANLTYAGTTFLNANPDEGGVNNAYDNVVSSDKTYDLEVNGTFKAYQVVLNNAATTVSKTGRLLATDEAFRVMGGTIAVQGNRAADAGVPEEIFTGSWGGGTKAGADTQIQGGYIDINQGAVATFADTVIFVHAGFFNVNASTAAFDNTYIYLGSGGSYADIQMNITNGAEVTFANNTTVLNDATFGMHITVGENSKLNLNNATFALDNSKKTTTLTNNGTVTVTGTSTLAIATVTGNDIELRGATLTDATVGGNVLAYGENTISGTNTINSLRVGYKAATAGNTTVGITGTYKGSFIVGWGDGNADSAYVLNIGTAEGARTTIGENSYGGSSILNVNGANGSANIVNTDFYLHQLRAKGNVNFTNSTIYLKNVDQAIFATVTLDKTIWDAENNFNSYIAIGSDSYNGNAKANASLVLQNGSAVNAYRLGLNNAGEYAISLTVASSTLTLVENLYIGAGSTFVIDAASTVSAETLSGAGNITIDATGMAAGKVQTIVDVTSSTFSGTISVTGNEANNATYYKNSQGDIILSTISSANLYVNATWAGKEVGTEVETGTGKYFGINAFATTYDAFIAARNVGGTITIDLTGAGAENTALGTIGFGNAGNDGVYTITGGSMATAIYGISFANTNTTVKFDNATFKVGKIYVANAGGALIVNNSVIGSSNYDGHNTGWVTAGKGSISITNSIFGMNFANYTAEQVAAMPRSASDVKDAVAAGNKYWQFGANNSGPHMGTAGAINVEASTLSTAWISLIDRGEMVLDNSVLYYGAAISIGTGQVDNSYGPYTSNEIGWDAQTSKWFSSTPLKSAEGFREGKVATLTVKDSIVRNIGGGNGNSGAHVQVGGSYVHVNGYSGEQAGILNLINSEFYTTPYDADGNAIAKNYDMIVVKSNGTVNMTDSKLVSAKVINEGAITVSGASTLDIDLIKGNDITASGVLKDSDLTFEVFDWQTGNVMVDQALEVQGGSFKNVQFRADEGEKITLTGAIEAVGATQFKAVNGEIVVNGTFFSDVSEASSIEIEGDASKLTIAAGADVEITGGFYLNGGTTVINGNLDPDTADAKVVLERTDADVETAYATLGGSYAANVTVEDAYIWNAMASINNAETQITLDNSRFDGWMSFDMNGGTLTVQNGSYLYHQAAEGWTRSTLAGNLIVTTGSVFNANKTNVTLSGNLTVDETAKITVGSIVNTGTINFTVTGEAAKEYMGGLVIDANAASEYGQVNVSVEGKNFEAVVNGNDLYVVDTTIYVNSAWATTDADGKVTYAYAVGEKVAEGLYFGVNAFASLESISAELSQGARQVRFTYNGDAPGLEITVKNDDGASLIYTFGGQVYASVGGNNVHEFAPKSNVPYFFDFKQGNYSFAVNEIAANEDTTVTPGTGSNSASGTVDVAVNEFSGRKDIGFTVATGMEGAIELDIANLDGAAWVVLYDADGKTVKEHVVIRDGKVTFKDLAAGSYEVAISAAGIPSEVECDVTYNFTQEAVVVTDDTWNNATLFGVDTTAGTTVTDEFTATDVIDWFKFSAADGVNAINFTAEGDFSVIAYTKNGDKLQQCAAFWVFDNGKTGDVDYTRYLNVAAGSEVYLRIEGYGKEVDYSVALA